MLIIAREKSSRKYLLTINNPIEKGFTHEQIKNNLESLKIEYWCLCDEIGLEDKTPHTHIFLYAKNAIMFSTIKTRFYHAHIDNAKGSCQQNRDYIRKEGISSNSIKKETNLIDTFEEFGIMPIEKSGSQENISSQVLQMIQNGCNNIEIIEEFPSFMTKTAHLDKMRQTYREKEFANKFRELEVTYIFGETETGKTRYVMEKYGYESVYTVTNYEHPFDSYEGQDIILFDEFRSSLPLSDMLQYLHGHPCRLPARYTDRQACYTKVYLISNIPFEKQYPKESDPNSIAAFRRRINTFLNFEKKDKSIPIYVKDNISIIETWE